MQPFQSRLFNWISKSPPFKWGKNARRAFDQWRSDIPKEFKQFWEDTTHNFLAPKDSKQSSFQSKPRASLPPWERFLARFTSNKIAIPNKKIQSYQSQTDLEPPIDPDRLRAIFEAAMRYFFRQPKLTVQDRQAEYDDECGPWPLPPQLANPYIDDPPKNSLDYIDRSTEIYQWVLEEEEEERPLRAWLEAKATFLGYAHSPLMEFLYWLDRWIARCESWFSKVWDNLWRWLRGDYYS